MTWTVKEWTLKYVYPPSHYKFYRILLFANAPKALDGTEFRVVTQWGRIGTDGQNRVQIFTNYWDASNLAAKVRDSKHDKGYEYEVHGADLAPSSHVLLLAGITSSVEASAPTEPSVASVETEIVELLGEIGELQAVAQSGKKVPKKKYEDLMTRYSELVQRSEEVTAESAEAADRIQQAKSMAFTGVMNLGVPS